MALVGLRQPVKMPLNRADSFKASLSRSNSFKRELNKSNSFKEKINIIDFPFYNYISSYSPGKKGGSYELLMGGKIIIPEGALNKKDYVKCGVIPPFKRYLYQPSLNADEHVHSEIYQVDTSYNHSKNPIFLHIPYKHIDYRLFEINVRGHWVKEDEWVNVGFLSKTNDDNAYAELKLHRGGVFIVTYLSKKEKFEFTQNGSLYSSRLCRFCTFRCPRKAVDNDVYCSLQVIPIPPEKLEHCQKNYLNKCSDLLDCTEIVDVFSSQTEPFRRPITIKMPVPNENQTTEVDVDDLDYEVAVIMKESTDSEWDLVESSRISRRMVSFDVKKLGRFCVVKVKKGRHRRMKDAITVLEEKHNKTPGCISLFIKFEEKMWTGAVSCYSKSEAEACENEWEKRNFTKIKAAARKGPEKTTFIETHGRRHEVVKYNDPEFFEGLSWTVSIVGNLNLLNKEDESRVLFYSSLKEHYCVFTLEPTTDRLKELVASVTVAPDFTEDDAETSRLTGFFTVEVDQKQIDSYFYVEPEPEEEVEVKQVRRKISLKRYVSFPPTNTEAPVSTALPTTIGSIKEKIKYKKVPSPAAHKNRRFTITTESMDRLTKTVRKTKIIPRESKVLTGRSLMNLARYISNGLNLAIQLGLSESCVTGLGFDALANGLNMSDITYKVLLYWKRHLTDKNESAVTQLALAFQQMGEGEVANIIMNRHRENAEITKECFAFRESNQK